jgi:hypothetical protein
MLTENSTNLLDSRCHIIVDRWKGMTKDQLDDIRHQQLIQIDEHQVHTLTDVNFYSPHLISLETYQQTKTF